MRYIYTPEDARPIANTVAKFMQRKGFSISVEKPLNYDAPCSTTLIATKAGLNILLEARYQVSCEQYMKELSLWLHKHLYYAELFISTHRSNSFSGEFLKDLDRTGIGLILVDDDSTLKIERHPSNPALTVNPSPHLKFGSYVSQVKACLDKFNQPLSFLAETDARKDALRDLCELVEGITEDIAIGAVKKGYLQRDEEHIKQGSWSDQINMLAAASAYKTGHTPFVSDELKTDLHAFRNGRNLVDHKVRSKQDDVRRQQKFPDRMIMGIRLVSDLVSLKSQISRKKRLIP